MITPFYYTVRWKALETLRRISRRVGAVVLTYDDGPGGRLSRSLLELLVKYDAKATFFLLGRRIEAGVEVVEMANAAGHELGVHTFNHSHAWKVPSREAIHDIDAGYAAAARWVPSDGLFRPPHGKISYSTWRALRQRSARICWWTVDSGDTWPVLPSPERTVDQIRRDGGGVVLMHDFDRELEREAFVLATTELLLKAAKKDGLRVMTLSELFALSGRGHERSC